MTPRTDDEAPGPDRPPSTRREFVQQSLLAWASATMVTELGAAVAAPGPSASAPIDPRRTAPTPAKPATPWPLFPYGSGEPIYLANFDQCVPASALAREWTPNCWKLLEFEGDKVKGVMLTAGQNTPARDVEYPLTQRGWYAISFGLMSKYYESRLEVRLKRERIFSLLTHNRMAETGLNRRDIEFSAHAFSTRQFDEMFWNCVELQGPGDAIVFRQVRVNVVPGQAEVIGDRCLPCWLGYIKLVPLSDAEVQTLKADRARRDTRRLFATNDAFGSLSWLHLTTADDVRREIEPYRNSDFSRMYWEAGMGDVTYFPSKVGKLITFEWMKDHYRLMDRLVGQTYADFRAKGIDPFRVALDHCHEIGLEFHASYRVAGFHFPAPEDEWNRGGFYDQHPEWRGRDRAGRPTPRMSYAFPGVRQFVLNLLREIATYPVDGVCLLFNRRLPVLEYEAPLLDDFKAKHGLDARTLDERDPRWLALRAAVLTGFMRDVRTMLREEQVRQNRRQPIAISAVIVSSRDENYENGLDLETWVAENLVDTLVPYSSAAGISSDAPSWDDPRAAEFFVRLTRNTSCQLALNLMPRQILPEDYKRRAHALYQAGVEHLYFWDCHHRNTFDRSWSTLSRLGHREELAEWARQGSPPVARPQTELSKIGDWDLTYGTPG